MIMLRMSTWSYALETEGFMALTLRVGNSISTVHLIAFRWPTISVDRALSSLFSNIRKGRLRSRRRWRTFRTCVACGTGVELSVAKYEKGR